MKRLKQIGINGIFLRNILAMYTKTKVCSKTIGTLGRCFIPWYGDHTNSLKQNETKRLEHTPQKNLKLNKKIQSYGQICKVCQCAYSF